MKVLISGFEPFLDVKINPSELVATQFQDDYEQFQKTLTAFKTVYSESYNLLMRDVFSQVQLKGVVLPVEFENAFNVLKKYIENFKPDLVLSLGVAAGRQDVNLERIAINCKSTSHHDNKGLKPKNLKINPQGPDGIFSNLNVDFLTEKITEDFMKEIFNIPEIKLTVSNTAGTYVCNALMYELFEHAKENNYLAGFIHLPPKTDESSILYFQNLILKLIKNLIR